MRPSASITGTSPVADLNPGWTPPWRSRERASGALVLIWTVPAVLRLELTLASAQDVRWIRQWLERYLALLPSGSAEEADFTFLYLLVGDLTDADPDGRVDGVAVLEAGFGGSPVGPEGGVPVAVDDLVRFALECLPA